MSDLFFNLKYFIKDDDFDIQTNIKKDQVDEIVTEFLRGQIGKGRDYSPTNEKKCYKIKIEVDLSFDIFKCKHNCGNLGLRDGILMRYLQKGE